MGYHEAYRKEELVAEMRKWEGEQGWSKPTFEQEYGGMPGDYYGRYGKEAAKEEDKQVGGSHYQLPIQPIDYIVKNNLGYREGNVIKYVTRHGSKNGAEDIKKAIHYLEMILGDYDND